jgi:hypothetical protein
MWHGFATGILLPPAGEGARQGGRGEQQTRPYPLKPVSPPIVPHQTPFPPGLAPKQF